MVEPLWVPARTAWWGALYGAGGFYRTNQPSDHFRTSAHASPMFARAVVELAERHGLSSVCDLGSGSGELLAEVHRQRPTWQLLGVEVRARPSGLPDSVQWQRDLPTGHKGLLLANEVLDNVPCDVVEIDASGRYRIVEVDRASGAERLGELATDEQVSWLKAWWSAAEPGVRAEVGLAREAFWATVCQANPEALSVAVDYGHTAALRPVGGSLSSYRRGRQTAVSYDGKHDITAHVAFDSLARRVGGAVRRQRDVLTDLGLTSSRPPFDLASRDPVGYLRRLTGAAEVGELVEIGGLGDFCWVIREPV